MSKKKGSFSSEKSFLPLMCDTLPDKYRLKAKKELNETEDNIRKGLTHLRECIKNEKLPVSTDETFLLSILRPTKYNLRKAEEKLKNFPKIHQMWAECMETSSLDKIKAVLESKMIGLLPYRDDEGRVIIFARPNEWDKSKFDLNDAGACLIALLLFAFKFPLSSVCGINYLNDAKVDSVFDLIQILTGFRKMVTVILLAPYSFKRVDTYNNSHLEQCFYMTIRPLLPAKLKNRICLHGKNSESIRKKYPPTMLPFEFGGTMGPLSADSYLDSFLNFVKGLESEICR